MQLPESLPDRLYLLAYDLRRGRLNRGHIAAAGRAAALEELRLQGHLYDDAGKVRVRNLRTLADPVLDAVLHEVGEGSRPRPWKYWIASRERLTGHAIRDQLEDRLYLRVDHRRVLGLFPHATVTAREPRIIEQLQHTIVRALVDGPAVSHVDPRDAALIAFAALVPFGAILPRRLRREHKRRIAEFVGHVAPVAPALKKLIDERNAASSSGG